MKSKVRALSSRLIILVPALLLTAALSIPGLAQTSTPNGASNAWSTPRALATYQLGPGDVLGITVEEYDEYSYPQVEVAPDGKINLPVYGNVQVSGRTIAQVQLDLLKRLETRMRAPNLNLTLVQPRPAAVFFVNVLGSGIRAPGLVQISPDFRVTEAIAKAGGLVGRPEDTDAELTRGSAKPVHLDLVNLLDEPQSAANLPVQPNDILTVNSIEPGRITLDGDIVHPGEYLLREFPTPGATELPLHPHLRDAIVAAGSLKWPYGGGAGSLAPNTGASSAGGPATGTLPAGGDAGTSSASTQAMDMVNAATHQQFTGYILRGKNRIPLNVTGAVDFSDRNADVELLPGDYVRFEAIPPTVIYIEGEVHNTGDLALPGGSGVIEAIAGAGGLLLPPDQLLASVRRGGQVINVDLSRALLSNDPNADVKLLTGDIVLLAKPATIKVTFSGAFNKPGELDLPVGTTLLGGIAQAGGLGSGIDETRLGILRTVNDKDTVLNIDPVALFRDNDLSQNLHLKDGDLVNAAQVKVATVFVSGEVTTTGAQTLTGPETLADAITKAGGPTLKAALRNVTVERQGATISVDTYSAVREGAPLDFPLQDGDYIVVPQIKKKVLVMNAVTYPNYYPLPEKGDLTVLGAITLAGGATRDAITKNILLLRKTPSGVQKFPVSLDKIGKGDFTGDTLVMDGDVIYVPRVRNTASTADKIQQDLDAAILVPALVDAIP